MVSPGRASTHKLDTGMEQLKDKDQAFAADPARLERRVRTLVEKYFPRNITHPENLNSAANRIGREMRAAGATVTYQPFDFTRWEYPQLERIPETGKSSFGRNPVPGSYNNVIGS
jgi:hypothetical protein